MAFVVYHYKKSNWPRRLILLPQGGNNVEHTVRKAQLAI
jgi:hypothetical protein